MGRFVLTVNAGARPVVGADSVIFDFAEPGGALAPFSDDMSSMSA